MLITRIITLHKSCAMVTSKYVRIDWNRCWKLRYSIENEWSEQFKKSDFSFDFKSMERTFQGIFHNDINWSAVINRRCNNSLVCLHKVNNLCFDIRIEYAKLMIEYFIAMDFFWFADNGRTWSMWMCIASVVWQSIGSSFWCGQKCASGPEMSDSRVN